MAANPNLPRSKRKRVVLVAANPSTASTTGWPVGFWASELTHPWYEFTEAGYEVDIASPQGGKIVPDAYSDPRDPSGYSAADLISMGFLSTPKLAALLDQTKKLSEIRAADYDAIVVTGGQAPMFAFPKEERLHALIASFYEAERITAALCHGVCALLFVRRSDGTPLIQGKTITGFANVEEDFVDAMVGQKFMPFRIEDEARRIGANFIQAGLFRPHAVRDGRLITGQQQHSGSATAKLVIEALGL